MVLLVDFIYISWSRSKMAISTTDLRREVAQVGSGDRAKLIRDGAVTTLPNPFRETQIVKETINSMSVSGFWPVKEIMNLKS